VPNGVAQADSAECHAACKGEGRRGRATLRLRRLATPLGCLAGLSARCYDCGEFLV
jgi:hypothetical protein